MCFAQDDLLKWGAVLFLRFLGQSGTPIPTEFGENFDVLLVGEDIILPPCLTQCHREAFPSGEGGRHGAKRSWLTDEEKKLV